jgi:hypothetical protein
MSSLNSLCIKKVCCDIRSILVRYGYLDGNIKTGMPQKTKEDMTCIKIYLFKGFNVRWINSSVV